MRGVRSEYGFVRSLWSALLLARQIARSGPDNGAGRQAFTDQASAPHLPNAAASNEDAAAAISRLARVRVVSCNTVSRLSRRFKPGFWKGSLLSAPFRSPLPRIEHSSRDGLKDMSLVQGSGGERSKNNDLQEDFAYLGSTSTCKTESQRVLDKLAVSRPLRQALQRFAAARARSLRSRHPR